MYTRLALLGIGIFLFLAPAFSQAVDPNALGYYIDALRFSQTTPFGTARTQGMGGVNNALGGDMASLAGNPAGLGVYNRSELGISPAFGYASSQSTFMNSSLKDGRGYLYFPSVGAVFAGKRNFDNPKKFVGGAFGIGLTRINNFQNQFSYSGTNNKTSMLQYFADLADGTQDSYYYNLNSDELNDLPSLAYYTFLIDPNPNDPQSDPTTYIPMVSIKSSKQEETVTTRGAISQWNFTYGGNFNDKVYIGASLGLPQVRYISEKSYREDLSNKDTLKNFKLNENLKVKGSGINFKVGVIVRPADWLRLGLTLQTPTYFGLNENYVASITANFNNFSYGGVPPALTNESEKTVPSLYKYNLTTPARIGGGIALFAGKKGFVSADLEYVPYNTARLKENGVYKTPGNSTFTSDNRTINMLYKGTVNVSAGAEYRKDIFRLRAGFAMMGDPYINLDNVSRKTTSVSLGAGVRLDEYYFDVAVVNSKTNSIYQSYTVSNAASPQADLKHSLTNVVISTGVFF